MTGPTRDIRLQKTGAGFVGSFPAMGSPCDVLTELDDRDEAERLVRIVADEAWRIEAKYSRYLPGNIVDQINTANGQAITVDEETARLVDFANTLFDISGGKFDITSGTLREAWTFDGGNRVPDQALIDTILPRVGWNKVSWRVPTITLPAHMQLDLGGIGKEYAVDRAAGMLVRETAAPCLVNFGGDLAATRAPTRRPAWRVGIESLRDGQLAERLIDLKSGALATSGDARRFVMRDGERYGHILDPDTGWPIEAAPRSVTVAADTCTQAGMLATLAMLCGAHAETFLEEEGVQYWCTR